MSETDSLAAVLDEVNTGDQVSGAHNCSDTAMLLSFHTETLPHSTFCSSNAPVRG